MKWKMIKRFFVIVVFFSVLAFSFRPVSVVNEQPFLLSSARVDDVEEVKLLENHPTEYAYKNTNLNRLYLMQDEFSDKYGMRPYPWGQEIFGGDPTFEAKESTFKIKGDSLDDIGVLAVPEYTHKPLVLPERLYYLSFRIKYDFEEGKGIRLMQQFFIDDDFWYPTFAVFGPYITGSSDGEWEEVGLLARAPKRSVRGDPVILLDGIGELHVDSVYFGEATIDEQERGDPR